MCVQLLCTGCRGAHHRLVSGLPTSILHTIFIFKDIQQKAILDFILMHYFIKCLTASLSEDSSSIDN